VLRLCASKQPGFVQGNTASKAKNTYVAIGGKIAWNTRLDRPSSMIARDELGVYQALSCLTKARAFLKRDQLDFSIKVHKKPLEDTYGYMYQFDLKVIPFVEYPEEDRYGSKEGIKPEQPAMRIGGQSNAGKVAGAIAHAVENGCAPDGKHVKIASIGVNATNQAIAALVIARGFLGDSDRDIEFQPYREQIQDNPNVLSGVASKGPPIAFTLRLLDSQPSGPVEIFEGRYVFSFPLIENENEEIHDRRPKSSNVAEDSMHEAITEIPQSEDEQFDETSEVEQKSVDELKQI